MARVILDGTAGATPARSSRDSVETVATPGPRVVGNFANRREGGNFLPPCSCQESPVWNLLQPLVVLGAIVGLALALALVLEHGSEAARRVELGATPFPVIDGETEYPAWFPSLSLRQETVK